MSFFSDSKRFLKIVTLAGVLLPVGCGEGPKPVSNNTPPPPPSSSGGYAPAPQQQPAGTPAAPYADEKPGPMPPVPETMTSLEKEHQAKPADAKVKTELIKAKMEYADLLMYGQEFDRKMKYRVALKQYREVLALDPIHAKALEGKNTIESIYKSMGRPIPE